MDRRVAIKWLMAATAYLHVSRANASRVIPSGYGMSPDLLKSYTPGELWPLTLTQVQRVAVSALCDTIIPADSESPSASSVGVPNFIDEWISAPYKDSGGSNRYAIFTFGADRTLILAGIKWLDDESVDRFGRSFAALTDAQKAEICDDICYLVAAKPKFQQAARFFARFRDLTSSGFYTSPEGREDLKYIGNTPLAQFDGPPPEVLEKVGLI